MNLLRKTKRAFHEVLGEPVPRDNARLKKDPDVLHIGPRAYSRCVTINGIPHFKKVFSTTTPGRRCFAAEKLANKRFGKYPWMSTWTKHGPNWLARPLYPDESRLDMVAQSLDHDDRMQLAARVLSIALDIYVEGYAHRDFHAHNLFCVDGQVKLADFETLTAYPGHTRPPFPQSYDVTGKGLESPYLTGNMGFAGDHPKSVCRVLDISYKEAVGRLQDIIKEELRRASLTFKKGQQGRHVCKAQRIYAAFDLPGLTVKPSEAQRDCARRLGQFGVTRDRIAGKSLLDLGSNIGGTLFEIQKFAPGKCLGIEYDTDKVAVSKRVAAFCELSNVGFVIGDVDKLSKRSIGGPYDVVFCLAINSHVRKPKRLYRILGNVTKECLYFEGNASTDVRSVEQRLLSAGFRTIEHLGFCEDDCLEENNQRPLLRAWKW